ncbi:MAG: PHP domain-containing protein [Oscillospiraceae bacterium]
MLIEADMHCHSVASTHAYSTVREIAECAAEIGLKAFALTDHCPLSPDSPHLWHIHNMKCLPRKIHGVTLIKGAEANIDEYGKIDLGKYEFDRLEWIVASFHNSVVKGNPYGDFSEQYIHMAKDIPEIDAVGHCTTLNFPFDYERVLKVFKEYGKLVEINESSVKYHKGSADNCRKVLEICKKYEIPIVVDTDTHYCESVGITDNAEKIISECNFPKKLILNSDFDKLAEFIENKRNISLIQ